MNKKSVTLFLIFMFIYTMGLIHLLRPDLIFMTGNMEKAFICVEDKARTFLVTNLTLREDREDLLNKSLDYSIEACDRYIQGYAEDVYQVKYADTDNPDSTIDDIKSDIIQDMKIYFEDIVAATFVKVDKVIERDY